VLIPASLRLPILAGHRPEVICNAVRRIVLNAGSSSVKFGVFSSAEPTSLRLNGVISGIGSGRSRLHATDAAGNILRDQDLSFSDQEEAIEAILYLLDAMDDAGAVAAVGHRLVHGGPDCTCPALVTLELEAYLNRLVPLAPLHLPHNIAGIAAVRARRHSLHLVASLSDLHEWECSRGLRAAVACAA
jgi:acetate kinase